MIGFVEKGESVSLCLSMIITVCEEMLEAHAVTASLWNLLFNGKYILLCFKKFVIDSFTVEQKVFILSDEV